MKLTCLTMILLMSLIPAGASCADIYQYTDQGGNVRWTDDLSQVPEAQRAAAERTKKTAANTANGEATPPAAEAALDTVESEADTGAPATTPDLDRTALEAERAELDTLYQQLIEERKTLEQMKSESSDTTDRTVLNDRIEQYNRKTEAYEVQLNRFNNKVNAYNQQIVSQQSPSSE
jgi:hypothetical protein